MTSPENNLETENEVENIPEQEMPPIIPPIILLIVAAAGLLVTLIVPLATGEFNIVAWSGLAVGVLALIIWGFMFPEEILGLIKGRALTFGGLGLVVTAILIIAAALVYTVIVDQGWIRDFSERDVFSLDEEVRDVLVAMGDDPSIPTVQILGFYNAASGSQRDQMAVLLQDMVNNSGGKIAGYEFIDPDIQLIRTQDYLGQIPRLPSIVVAKIDETTREASSTDFELAARDSTGQITSNQFQIINAILSLSVDGDFRAYFLNVDGSLDIESGADDGANGFVSSIEDEWTVESLDPLLLPNLPVTLNDPLASAEVMIIAGGTQALSDEEVAVIADYVQNGGDLIVFADINTEGGDATALADNFSNMLLENFGVRFRNDLVIDPANPVRQLGRVYLLNNYGTHSIVSGLNPETNNLVVSSPRSIEISENPPAEVSVLVSTSEDGYAKSGLDFSTDLTQDDLAFAEGDLEGAIPLAVAAENAETGSRLVLFGSSDLMQNEWSRYVNIEAPEVSESVLFWVSEAQNFSEEVRQLVPEPPEADQPIFITGFQARWMGFIAYGAIPFGLLALGAMVWYIRRPSHTT